MEVVRHTKSNILGYNPEDINAADQLVCKNVSEVLENHFPGWEWLVGVEHGLVRIHSFKLSTLFGFRMRVDKIDNDYKCIVLAGGEILERYGMPRGRYNHSVYMERQTLMLGPKGFEIACDDTKSAPQRITY